MVSVSSVVFSKVENGGRFGKLGLTNQAQRIKELRGANEVVFESALGQGANMNTANHDAETQFRCGHPISRKLKLLTSSANTTSKRVKS